MTPDSELSGTESIETKWQVLDELQKQLLSLVISDTTQAFRVSSKHSGRPSENFYDQADKERLRKAFESIYQERHDMTVEQGWTEKYEQTKLYLMAFVLACFRNPYGKLASYHRFLYEVCDYTFIPVLRTFQNWFNNYQAFVNEREKRTANLPKNESEKAYKAWKRKVKKYQPLEALTGWICERLPQYGVSLA